MSNYDLIFLFGPLVLYATVFLRPRDFYVVVREFRFVTATDFGKGKQVESSYVHSFDDYLAAKAFFDLHESYNLHPHYENQQGINYVYAVPAFTASSAEAKMTKTRHHKARLLIETPFSALSNLKKYWDAERKTREELKAGEPSVNLTQCVFCGSHHGRVMA